MKCNIENNINIKITLIIGVKTILVDTKFNLFPFLRFFGSYLRVFGVADHEFGVSFHAGHMHCAGERVKHPSKGLILIFLS